MEKIITKEQFDKMFQETCQLYANHINNVVGGALGVSVQEVAEDERRVLTVDKQFGNVIELFTVWWNKKTGEAGWMRGELPQQRSRDVN